MTQNELSAVAVAIGIGIALLRGVFRALRNLARGDASQMNRMTAAAKKVLAEQQQTRRGSVPTKGAQGRNPIAAGKAKPRPVRSAAAPKKPQGAGAALLSKTRAPAVVRPGLFAGKEPVIQRRR